MSEFLTIQVGQVILASLIAGTAFGSTTYMAVQAYNAPKPYAESTHRATTFTGKGQFKCQTGCPSPQFITK